MNSAEIMVDFKSIRNVLNSEIKVSILIDLFNGGKTLKQLADSSNKSASTFVNNLKFLEINQEIVINQDKYYLTSLGILLTLKIIAFINNWTVINDNFDFWQEHSMDSIPKNSLNNIGSLKDSEYILSSISDMRRSLITFMDILKLSDNSKIILPIFSEKHCDIIFNTLTTDSNKTIELCVNSNILKKIQSYYADEIIHFKNNGQLKFGSLNKDVDIFLVATNNLMSLNLFLNDGFYDDNIVLVNTSDMSIQWANNLFEYLKNRVDLSNNYLKLNEVSLLDEVSSTGAVA